MTELGPGVEVLLAGLARLDNRPETIAAIQRGLDEAWASLEAAGWRITS